MIMAQAALPGCPACVLLLLLLIEVTVRETLMSEEWLFEQQIPVKEVVKKSLKKVCEIKKVLLFFLFVT